MKTVKFVIEKEFRQLRRSRIMLAMMFVMPIIQVLILPLAANFEVKNIKLFVVDNDMSSDSRELISKFEASPYFDISGSGFASKEGEKALDKGTADLYIQFPEHFSRDIVREGKSNLMITVNSIDGAKAVVAMNYAASIIADYNSILRDKYLTKLELPINANITTVAIENRNWYNPELNYTCFMVPGILVLLVSIVGMFMAALNIVKEKEIGTIEQLNVTPIKKYELILGKLVPYWIIGMFELALGLFISKLVYNIPMVGSLVVLFGFAAVYLVLVLGIGLFISTLADTQQQALFITWFFMVIFVLLSGLFTAVENMPDWAQAITRLNPIRYFMDAVRMIMLKGAGFAELQMHIVIVIIYGIIINSLALWIYKKTV